MSAPAGRQPPAGSVEREEFYADDDRRHSHVLSYGSAWQDPSWTGDEGHVIELMWFGKTNELVAYYLRYDWSRLPSGEMGRGVLETEALDVASLESGAPIGRFLHDVDLATSDVWMLVLGVLPSALRCHELLWDWRWLQHHPDGLAEVKRRVAAALDERTGSA